MGTSELNQGYLHLQVPILIMLGHVWNHSMVSFIKVESQNIIMKCFLKNCRGFHAYGTKRKTS